VTVSSPHRWRVVASLKESVIQVTSTVTARAGGKSAGMTTAMEPAAGWCLGCGTRVTVEEVFCPMCGTRQVPDRPMPVDRGEDAERLVRSTNAWLLAAIVTGTVLLLVAAILAGWFGAAVSEDDDVDRIGRGAAESVEDHAGDASCCLRPAVAG